MIYNKNHKPKQGEKILINILQEDIDVLQIAKETYTKINHKIFTIDDPYCTNSGFTCRFRETGSKVYSLAYSEITPAYDCQLQIF